MKLHRSLRCYLIVCVIVLAYACSASKYKATNKQHRKQVKALTKSLAKLPLRDSFPTGEWVGTINFGLRKPNFVILHHTAQDSCGQTLKTFTTTASQVSAHYVICKDGTIHHMLNDYFRAWHGGVARWGNTTDINSSSIGIEIDNNGLVPFTDEQIRSTLMLLDKLKKAYNIPAANFIGHGDIAPKRKVDPSVYFPWKVLADSGYGLWWSDTTGLRVPDNFNSLQALRIIGYDVRDSSAVIQAFKRKYEQQDNSATLTPEDRKVLFALYRKYE